MKGLCGPSASAPGGGASPRQRQVLDPMAETLRTGFLQYPLYSPGRFLVILSWPPLLPLSSPVVSFLLDILHQFCCCSHPTHVWYS